MNATASAAVSVIARPFARIPEATRRRIGLLVLVVCRAGIPDRPHQRRRHRQHGERGGLCHARARAEHRRRFRRPTGPWVCRFLRHRRLHLRHSDRVPASAGMERVLGAVPHTGPRVEDGGRDRRHQRGAFHPVVLAGTATGGSVGGVLRHPVRRADAAPTRRLPRHRHIGLRRDRADRGAQLVGPYKWRSRTERRRRTKAVRLAASASMRRRTITSRS